MKKPTEYDRCAERLRALADPDRLQIVQVLRKGPRHVSDIAEQLGAEIANVSHHLSVLRREGLVETEKQGRFVLYQLHPDVFSAEASADEHLDLGCCRLELPEEAGSAPRIDVREIDTSQLAAQSGSPLKRASKAKRK